MPCNHPSLTRAAPAFTRRRLLIAIPPAVLVISLFVLFLIVGKQDLKSRSEKIRIGMTRKQVQDLLGRPALVLSRTGDRGHLSSWVDQLWQLDVITDTKGIVESIGCKPSDSHYRRTEAQLKSIFK